MMGQKYFKGGKHAFRSQKYTKYNKIYNNLENLRGKIAARGTLAPLVADLKATVF